MPTRQFTQLKKGVLVPWVDSSGRYLRIYFIYSAAAAQLIAEDSIIKVKVYVLTKSDVIKNKHIAELKFKPLPAYEITIFPTPQ